MSHLGRWLSALVDGELDDTERDRVLNHVAGCDACRLEANAMRALKRRLTALGETCTESAIAGRLIELARGEQEDPVGAARDSGSWWLASPGLEAGRWPGQVRAIRPGWKVATGSAGSALIALGVIAFLLGNTSGAPPAPKVTPSVDSYLLQHSRDAGQEPAGSGPGSGPAGPRIMGGGGYSTYYAGPVQLNPGRIGTAQPGQLAGPVGTASPGPVASATASPGPVASATGSPVTPAPSPSGRSPGTQAPSRHSK